MLITSVRVLLAVVFLSAGAAKLAHPRAAAEEAIEFMGVGARPLRVIAPAAPAVEIVNGFLLVLGGVISVAGSWLALSLLGLYSYFVARNVRLGRKVPCSCFGLARSAIVDKDTLLRNAGLVAAAATAAVAEVVRGTPPGPLWTGGVNSGAVVAPFILAASCIASYLSLHGVWLLRKAFEDRRGAS